MPQGKQTLPDIQWAIVQFSKLGLLNLEQIAMCLNTSTCTVKHVLSYFCTYGMVPNPGDSMATQQERKHKRHLHDTDVEFLLGTINKTPNLYLDELQEMLAVSCGVNISCATHLENASQDRTYDEKGISFLHL
ncbi:hypothetical protein PAXRUDRAFT_787652 [Paxillus rubicundulus Ve08.2h10]|uniref:Uncharacterized protein n=1 Tax=Paxillus rubicundulus Ve08.2h10 TaxID=930991 RepID=A0A0D0CVB4_9AGAM|nr:hypothetical protein PAXRUDRAFT_787652 [Paxillus rubicundulus Ve08.2h10]